MSQRRRSFVDFVDDRGHALMRTASLLEPDVDRAQDDLTNALGDAAVRWRSLSMDANVERGVRGVLYAAVLRRWRIDGGLDRADETPPADRPGVDDDVRRALATMTRRERTTLVLADYDDLSDVEIAGLTHTSSSRVEHVRKHALDGIRRRIGAGGNVGDWLHRGAVGEVPDDLAATAQDRGARRKRRRTLTAIGVVAAVVVGSFVAIQLATAGDRGVQRSIDAWGLPPSMPGAADAPTLKADPIDAASAAYVVDNRPVVVDAADGSPRNLLSSSSESLESGADIPRRVAKFTQVVLSPNGEWMLLTQVLGMTTFQRRDLLYLVDVDTGQVSMLNGISAASGRVDHESGLRSQTLAWAPDSSAFACACSPLGNIDVVSPGTDDPADVTIRKISTDAQVSGISWGGEGIAVKDAQHGGWQILDPHSPALIRTLPVDKALALPLHPGFGFMIVSGAGSHAIHHDRKQDGGQCVLWDESFDAGTQIAPIPDRDGPLCSPITMQQDASGFVLAVRPLHKTAEEADVVHVAPSGDVTTISSLPPSTSAASFAANLVG